MYLILTTKSNGVFIITLTNDKNQANIMAQGAFNTNHRVFVKTVDKHTRKSQQRKEDYDLFLSEYREMIKNQAFIRKIMEELNL